MVMESPALARAVYYSTELDQEIPAGLYLAVAQVLAYVYQLKQYQAGRASGRAVEGPADPAGPASRRVTGLELRAALWQPWPVPARDESFAVHGSNPV